jgi:hypothetical protein
MLADSTILVDCMGRPSGRKMDNTNGKLEVCSDFTGGIISHCNLRHDCSLWGFILLDITQEYSNPIPTHNKITKMKVHCSCLRLYFPVFVVVEFFNSPTYMSKWVVMPLDVNFQKQHTFSRCSKDKSSKPAENGG